MTFFEYMMVMVSLIMALALSHVMRASSDILFGPKRYWVHIVWMLVFVFLVLQGWWALWDQHTVTEWTILKYASMFIFPLSLFVIGSLLVPSHRAVDIDWKSHFYDKRKWLFSVLAFLSIDAILTPVLIFDATLVHPYRIIQLVMVSILIVGAIGKTHKTHWVIAVV